MYEDKPPYKPGTRVNGYVRDSGGDTQDLSVTQQVEELKRFCAQKKLKLHKIYIDEAKSGTSTVRRTAFQQMIARFRSKDCQEEGLVLWNYSRFARNLADFQFYIYDLQRRGIVIHALKDRVPDGLEGQLIRFVMAWSAQQYSEKLSEDSKRGLTHLVTEYGGVPGTPPPGFKRVPVEIGVRRSGRPRIVHRWEIDESSIDDVRLAWELRAAGASYSEILEKTGIYTSRHSLSSFFRNKLYIGILEFGDLTIDGYCDPVIDEETWEAVQRRNRRSAKFLTDGKELNHPNRLRGSYLLTGLVRCGHCGSAMNGAIVSKGGQVRYSYYWCNRAKQRRDCPGQRVPKDDLEKAVVERVSNSILMLPNLVDLYQEDEEYRLELSENGQQLQDKLSARKAANAGRIRRVVEAIESMGGSDVLLDRLRQLEEEADRLQTEQAALSAELEAVDNVLTRDELEEIAADLQRRLLGDLDEQRDVLQGFIESVVISREGKDVQVEVRFIPPVKKKLDRLEILCPRQESPMGHDWGHKFYTLNFTFSVRGRGRPPKKGT